LRGFLVLKMLLEYHAETENENFIEKHFQNNSDRDNIIFLSWID